MTLLRIGYCCAIALTGAALLPANGFGQQKSLRDQLVGVWVPTAHETTRLTSGTPRGVVRPRACGALPLRAIA